ncbi:ComF family protein [Leptospira jelokensis]|uniref:ComF family protein n=1 Tax=Leptospira jelokensis TaxID=2484931 RepID=UPI001FD2DD59|nr:phosphoribosyltransferase family protein [Leptospira jelokensis]
MCKSCTRVGYSKRRHANLPDPIPSPNDRFLFYETAYALSSRDFVSRDLFLSLKFQNEKLLGRYFILGWKRLLQVWKTDPPDCFVMVPSRAKVGPKPYHAAWALRDCLKYGQNMREDTSLRKISKDKQSEKRFEDRFFHAKKAFGFIKSDRIIEGLHVLLVDDIFTTGASLNEIARLYKLRGVRKVTCVVCLLSGVIESNGCSSQG